MTESPGGCGKPETNKETNKEPIDGDGLRSKFGNRFLMNEEEVFTKNAWDNVEWDEEQTRHAEEIVSKNSSEKLSTAEKHKYQSQADTFWDNFYGTHQNRFFKDRHWLFTEFPELALDQEANQPYSIFELGCGVGNTILPLLMFNQHSNLKVYGCDFSKRAIEILESSKDFDAARSKVFVMDAGSPEWDVPFMDNSLDIIVIIFVLSAIEPSKMRHVAENSFRYLRPGGKILFRDYGRYDMAQLRFKSGKCLEDNLYVRGDGTMVYFFKLSEVHDLFCKVGFTELEMFEDRRLQVNRGRMLKMYRVWIQAKFQKPLEAS